MLDYIILSADTYNLNEISGSIDEKTNIRLIITDNKRPDKNKFNNALRISGSTSPDRLNNIFDLVNSLDSKRSDNNSNRLPDYLF